MQDKKGLYKLFVDKNKVEWIIGITEILAFVYPIASYINNYLYQNDCEDFYHIAGKYFNSTVNNKILYSLCLILTISLCFLPLFMNKYENSNKKNMKWLIILMLLYLGFGIGIINMYNLEKILQKIEQSAFALILCPLLVKIGAKVLIIIIVIISLIAVFGLYFYEKLQMIKNKTLRRFLQGIINVGFVANIIILIWGAGITLTSSIADKRKYEVVEYENENYMILSENEDKMLVAKYSFDNEQYTVYTKEYFFIDKWVGTYGYIELNKQLNVICDKTLEESR